MLSRLIESTVTFTGITTTTYSSSFDLSPSGGRCSTLSVQSQVDVTTPTGATISYQRSNKIVDGGAPTAATDWDDIDTATSLTVDTTAWYSVIGPTWRWFRIKAVITGGSMTIINYVLGCGESKS